MKRVLVIEDNDDNMKLITFILEKNGYGTIRAENGKTGIELALKEKPDFILLDIQLPDMDGTEVLKELRKSEIDEEVPIIAITSYAMSGDRERLMEAGCNGYIEKPIDPVSIINQIREITGEKP
ncbi:MAG: response regulator [Deltaproteobacteria bacterium]|nr:response regulator [Deltaproteobacteria bacterium]MBW2596398.1 response regulator [Deltaproteobacteria bacterium]